MKNNIISYYIKSCTYNCATLLVTGTVIQAFLLAYGVAESSVSLFISALQIVQVLIMILFSGYIERTSNVIGSVIILTLLHTCLPICLIAFCIFKDVPANVAFCIIFGIGILENIFRAITTVLEYKLPYHVINIKEYGKATGISSALYGIFGAILSAVLSFVTSGKSDYFKSMSVFFLLALLLELTSSMALKKVRPLACENQPTKSRVNFSMLKYKPFYALIVPNLLRGINFGVFSVAAIIAHYFNLLDSTEAAILVTLTQIATILGSFFYSKSSGKNRDGIVILISGILVFIFMPLMMVGNSKLMFLIFYFLSSFAISFINCGVPVAVTKFVEYDRIGQYSAWRMMLHTLGVAIGSGIIVFSLECFGGIFTMIIAGAMQLISSISYYIYLKNNQF